MYHILSVHSLLGNLVRSELVTSPALRINKVRDKIIILQSENEGSSRQSMDGLNVTT